MVNLSAQDHQKLVGLLASLPELSTEASRRAMLEYAGLKRFVPMIDLSSSTFVGVNQIVSYLSTYGRLTYEHEALGIFLNAVKGLVGVEHEEFLSELLIKYDMMTPITEPTRIDAWKGEESVDKLYEKIIGENTLRPIAFLDEGIKVSRAVAHVGVRGDLKRWTGTGFLVTPDLLFTNNHVLPSPDLLPTSRFRFNYEETFAGEAKQFREYAAEAGGMFHTNKALDYSIVQLENRPGDEWGWLPLRSRNAKRGERANIIQHPAGRPKEISFQNNFIEYVGRNVVQYVTSTQPGASGSPVLDDAWGVIAIHHAGGALLEPETQHRYFRNEGMLIARILEDLPPNVSERVQAAATGKP